jgi:hypothetical protein
MAFFLSEIFFLALGELAMKKLYIVYASVAGHIESTPFFKFTTKKAVDKFMDDTIERTYQIMLMSATKKKVTIKKFHSGVDVYVGAGNEAAISIVVRQADKRTKDEKCGRCHKADKVEAALGAFALKYVSVEDLQKLSA